MISNLKDGWDNREPREKKILILGGVALSVIIVFQWLLLPVIHYFHDLKSQVEHQTTLLTWMKQAESKINPGNNASIQQPVSDKTLLNILSISLNEQGIQPTQVRQDGKNNVNINFHRVVFNELLLWLHQLLSEYSVTIEQLTLSQTDTPGIVQGEIIIGQVLT